ncbi:MAG: FkbM family methyltransferase [Lachnospiraceae bacterium]|nr:FkbM family methyltransferase [Lachnospiraceae bacterium]
MTALERKERLDKMRIVFFGVGASTREILGQIKEFPQSICVLGFIDNDSERWGSFMGRRVQSPQILKTLEYDYIIILSNLYFDEMKDSLIYWHGVAENKIKGRNDLLQFLFAEKYKDSDDPEIQAILNYWNTNEFSVFNQYIKEEITFDIVEWDYIENMPYIMFEDKRMYFPLDTKFDVLDGKKVVVDILSEQQATSPHLYVKDDIVINDGDVIADAGVCEGNFILRYIEKVSKAYLFESDRRWKKALELSLKKFSDKVVMCDGYLGLCDGKDSVSLDTMIRGRLDFLKMDIEGAEPMALLGGRKVLLNNNVKCSICSYHRYNDVNTISDILQLYGYRTNTSDGYMLFFHDKDIFSSIDFRRGIVYGRKDR